MTIENGREGKGGSTGMVGSIIAALWDWGTTWGGLINPYIYKIDLDLKMGDYFLKQQT